MTKIPKGTITTLEGRYQDLVKNQLKIEDKYISVPVDRKVNGEVGDKIRITYDDRGFLLTSEVVEKGKPEKKATTFAEANKKLETECLKEPATTSTDNYDGDPLIQIPPRTAPNERLIVAQLLIKKWTDLYIGSNVLEPSDFDTGRKDILDAVEKDLDRVMAMGRLSPFKELFGTEKK